MKKDQLLLVDSNGRAKINESSKNYQTNKCMLVVFFVCMKTAKQWFKRIGVADL